MCNGDYLIHYGVQGMRWGHRKSVYTSTNKSGRKALRRKLSKGQRKALKIAVNVGAITAAGLLAAVGGQVLSQSVTRTKTLQNVTNQLLSRSNLQLIRYSQLKKLLS